MYNNFEESFNKNLNKIFEEIRNSEDITVINNNIKLEETVNRNIYIWLKISFEENKIIFLPYLGSKNSIHLKKQIKNRFKKKIIECYDATNIEDILKNNINDFFE
jgi:hypothetical protein